MALKLREADLKVDAERHFILHAWLRSFKRSHYSGPIPNNWYDRVYTETILQLIERGMTILLLEGADVDTFIGFVAFETGENPVVHYVYVKPLLQGNKFGQKLLLAAGVTPDEPWFYTFKTRDSRKFRGGTFAKAIASRKSLERKKNEH